MSKQLYALAKGEKYPYVSQHFAGDIWRCGKCSKLVGESQYKCKNCGSRLELVYIENGPGIELGITTL